MSANEAVERALREAGIAAAARGRRDLSGGCIHHVVQVDLDDGTSVVAKISPGSREPMLQAERAGLAAMEATGTVVVPQPLAIVRHEETAVLLMTAIQPAPATGGSWRSLGRDLAALHEAPAGERYGFEADNFIGATPQPNAWRDDWVEFNAEHRLGHQLRLARRAGLMEAGEARRIEAVIGRLGELIPRRPKPALLHGDLWSGNALPTRDQSGGGRIALIDPACSIGDGLADLAMMRLFGGFPRECFDEYFSRRPDREQVESRLAVYQLYHVLNHVNLFGRGYVGQAMGLAGTLGC
jgi:fructosamine-3-kinase